MSKSNEIAKLLIAAGCDPLVGDMIIRINGGIIMNDIENVLIENNCDAETINKVVNEFKDVAAEHSPLQACIAMALLLKILSKQGSDDPDNQLKLILELADCYDINLH